MGKRRSGAVLVGLVILGAAAFGLDLPLEDSGRVAPAIAEREIVGNWRVVAGYDTERPEFSRLVPPSETPWVEFRQDYGGTDATGPVSGVEFRWEVFETEGELRISLYFPNFEDAATYRLVFSADHMVLIRPDVDRDGDNPVINAIVYERRQ